MMYRSDGVDGLQFNDYQVFNEKVDAVAEIHLHAVVKHWQSNLRLRAEACFFEFVLETYCIKYFQASQDQVRYVLAWRWIA